MIQTQFEKNNLYMTWKKKKKNMEKLFDGPFSPHK